jgi:VWFA-related protein
MHRGFAPLLSVVTLFPLPAQTPVIRVDTRLVEVNVIVRDQNDRPVEGLTKNDFTVFDRNKQQKIALFSASSAHQLTKRSAPLPSGIYTNRPEQRAAAPTTATVVLLDAVNTRIEDQGYAKGQFVKFLSQIRPQDRVAVYALGNKLQILQDFTGDSKVLLNCLARYRGEPLPYAVDSEPDAADTANDDMDKWLNDKNALIADMAIQKRVAATVGAMEAIANHIGHLPGRKNLVWITGSFPFSVGQKSTESITNWEDLPDPTQTGAKKMGGVTRAAGASAAGAAAVYGFDSNSLPGNSQPAREVFASFDADLARATRALNNADIAVYPVDARGLIAVPKILTAQSSGIIKPGRLNQALPPLSLTPAGINTMQVMAENTGGKAYYNTNDLQHAIRDALDDSEVTYTLGFYADTSALDAEFHKLKVLVDRKHVEVRFRKGYMADPAGVPGDQERESVIRDALWSPLDSGGLSLAGRLERIEDRLRVMVSVEPSDLRFTEHDGQRAVSVEFAFALLGAEGQTLDTIHQGKAMDLDAKQYKELNNAFVVTKTLEPHPGVTSIRVVVLDRASGRIGSLTMPVK